MKGKYYNINEDIYYDYVDDEHLEHANNGVHKYLNKVYKNGKYYYQYAKKKVGHAIQRGKIQRSANNTKKAVKKAITKANNALAGVSNKVNSLDTSNALKAIRKKGTNSLTWKVNKLMTGKKGIDGDIAVAGRVARAAAGNALYKGSSAVKSAVKSAKKSAKKAVKSAKKTTKLLVKKAKKAANRAKTKREAKKVIKKIKKMF